ELDYRGPGADCGSDLLLGWFDEQADADARRSELVDIISEMIVLARGVETAFGRALLALLGDDAGGVRAVLERDREHFLRRRHFEVQRQVDFGHQAIDVGIGDVSPVFAKVGGDPVGPSIGGDMRGSDGIRMIAPARVPDGRDVVDIDAEAEALGHAATDTSRLAEEPNPDNMMRSGSASGSSNASKFTLTSAAVSHRKRLRHMAI